MTELPLLCLPYAGGSAARVFAGWPAALPPFVEVVAVELPGCGASITDPLLTSVDALARDTLGTILPQLDGRPFALFGHSLGALIAFEFEFARRLEHQHGRAPRRLFVSAYPAPHLPPRPGDAIDLPLPQFRQRLRKLAGTPEELLEDHEVVELFALIIRADLRAAGRYEHRDVIPLSCPVTVYGGIEDPETPPATLPPRARHTAASCVVRMLPGDHFFLNQERSGLLADLSRELNAERNAD